MNSCKRSAIWVCLTFAVLAAGPVWAQPDGEAGPEARAARLEEARGIVVEDLNRRSVRPVAAAVIRAEAERIVLRMSDEQLTTLLEGEDLGTVLAKGPRGLATAQVTEGAEAEDGPRLATASAVGDAESHLLFVPLDPCRIIDTRKPGAGGMLTPGNVRHFHVAGTAGFDTQGGNAGGCGVPMGGSEPIAAAVAINLVAIQAQGSGHFLAWEFNQPVPLASVINYDKLAPFFNIANGTILPIAGISTLAKDLSVRADFNGAHLVADVTGYFTRFPVENFQTGLKSDLITRDWVELIDLSDGACRYLNNFCTVTTTTPGTVIVEAWGQFVANHTAGTLDRVAIGIETADPVVCNDSDTINASDFEVPASMGTNPDVDFTVSHGRSFSQPANTTRTYRLSGQMVSGANTGDKIENSRIICTFIPD